ncbi:hypothetical protein K2173_017992 [Erythroxylum novogranatense]|uniref:Glycosyltransferase n=1 Tax=Erythroxylum novogranatense TaxID=1862640 RepID=A0AAV8TU65_9ROSI|nr:hypothetical protein K2173_017992 [Erythroxylum novogranatense]
MAKTELVFVPLPGVGHIGSAVELAKVLIDRDERLSFTVVVMKMPFDTKTGKFVESLAKKNISGRIRFVELPSIEFDPNDTSNRTLSSLIETQKPLVREAVSKLIKPESSPDSPQLGGFVVDMFCTQFIDVANEFGLPSYVFFTSSATYLGLMLYIQSLHDDQKVDPTKFEGSDVELSPPTSTVPIPAKVLPAMMSSKDSLYTFILQPSRGFRHARGIVVNTFTELESYAINTLTNDDGINAPPIYPVGPILTKSHEETSSQDSIMQWLDEQASSSVLFLCFGTLGSFGADQVKEIALALERSGHHFLWSLREPTSNEKKQYLSPDEVLPAGFLDRTAEIGKVIGWAPQTTILAHKAIGGFVSHCGWNSTLESLWYGVPIATLPIYGEQQVNAFLLVEEWGLGVEIKMDFRRNIFVEIPSTTTVIVAADVIERGIKSVMEGDNEVRKRVKEMSKKCRQALMEGGSSHASLGYLIEDIINNVSPVKMNR